MHAYGVACDGRQERDAVVVSVSCLIFVNFPFGCKEERCVKGTGVGQRPVKVRISLATPYSIVGYADIDD